MRILSINKFYYIHGGSERYLFDLNAELEKLGHEIIPFAMSHPKNEDTPYSDYFPSQSSFSPSNGFKEKIKSGINVIYSHEAQSKLDALLKVTKPQLAHLQNIAHQLSPSILYALKSNGIPIIQTLHDLKMVCPTYTMYTQGQVCERCLHGQYYNALRYRCNKGSLSASAINMVEMYLHRSILNSYNKVNEFISPSAFLRNKMIEGGIPPNKIHHIPNFININDYIPRYKNDGYLLFFGQLIAVKGVNVLLRAIKKIPNVHVVIAGRGDDKEKYELFAKRHNLNVSFVGFQSGDALQKLVQNSLAVIVPSVWYENQPYSILEAFAYGKPVIASNLGGMAELISEGETGYLFEPENSYDLAEKIKQIISEPKKIIEMGQVARKTVEQEYNANLHLKRILKLYNQVL